MPRFIIGGRPLSLERVDVETAMRGVLPETFRSHIVEMLETVYPPKQVVAEVTGWDRQSFTTQEAQRVLTKLGFICRRAGEDDDGRPAWIHVPEETAKTGHGSVAGVEELQQDVAIMKSAIESLLRRVDVLERRH